MVVEGMENKFCVICGDEIEEAMASLLNKERCITCDKMDAFVDALIKKNRSAAWAYLEEKYQKSTETEGGGE